MFRHMFPFFASLIALLSAQILKPVFHYLKTKEWDVTIAKDSGGFPSSHSALVSALALSVGLNSRFSSPIFAITLSFATIVIYDAANVRYYSGQHIKLTQQLVKDLKNQLDIKLDDPIYKAKLKDVLGHRWFEVTGGIILGAIITLLIYYFNIR